MRTAEYVSTENAEAETARMSFPRKRESIFGWMPDQVRHDTPGKVIAPDGNVLDAATSDPP